MSKYYKDHYDVIIVGSALAGLTSAITLNRHGYDVLVLEQHNLPGGVATSFVRSGVEIEASLHEMMGIGSVDNPLPVRKQLEDLGVHVDWIRIPTAFNYVDDDINITIHSGENGDFSLPAKEITDACGGDQKTYKKILKFFKVCLTTYQAMNEASDHKMSNFTIIRKYPSFVKTLGYSYLEVAQGMGLPQKAIDIIGAYWVYLGSPLNDLPFSIYAYILTSYLGYGAYIPKHTSYEMSMKLLNAALELGIQVEFNQKVRKIRVKNNKIEGITLENGEQINSNYVISGAYPNTVFSKMIDPLSEVPQEAKNWVNGMDLGVSCFSLILLLDLDYDQLGIKDYATFYAHNNMHSEKTFKAGYSLQGWDYLTTACPNIVNNEASPKGTCLYSITYLPSGDSFKDVDMNNYEEYKKKNIDHFLELESNRLGINLKEHILEMVVETPVTIAHYTGAYMGAIYGYRHSMNNHVVARQQMDDKEHFISGLAFAGAHQVSGDGMAPAFSNGVKAANEIMQEDKRRKALKNED